MKVEPYYKDSFRIIPITHPSTPPESLIFPTDFSFLCEWDATSWGSSHFESNTTGYFCVLRRSNVNDCSSLSTLTVIFKSSSAGFEIRSNSKVASTGSFTFGLVSDKIYLSSRTKEAVIPISVASQDLKIEASYGLNVLSTNEGQIRIRATDFFRNRGTITLVHKSSGNRAKIEVISDQLDGGESDSKRFKDGLFFQDALLYFFIAVLLALVILLIMKICTGGL